MTFSSQIKFSTNFLEVFFSKESATLLHVTSKLGLSNNIYIAKKGFNDDSLNALRGIAEKLQKVEGISKVQLSITPSKELRKYYKKNYYLLADFNDTKLSTQEIHHRLHTAYTALRDTFIYMPLDTNDPLGIFSVKAGEDHAYLKLKDYGYVLKASVSIDTSSATEAKQLYTKVNILLKDHKDLLVYAPFFFLVENSSYIRSDTQKIITLATVLLLLLYFFMLRNYRLLFHTIIAIGSSVLAAIIASAYFFGSVNIMVLAFGISITTISIDYMFHYYFHGDFSTKGFIKQKRVFFGFLTTFGVFVIFSFISIRLFYELAVFSAVSLLVAYILFSWVFSYIEIEKPKLSQSKHTFKKLNPLYLFLISFILFGYSYTHLKFDDDLRNLDYKNEKLLALSQQFREGLMQSNYQTVLLHAETQESLLQKYEKLEETHPNMQGIGKFLFSKGKCEVRLQQLRRYDFKKLREAIRTQAKKIGFTDVFEHLYAGLESMNCNTMHTFDAMGFKIVKENSSYYTAVFIPKKETVAKMEGVEILDITKHLSKDMQNSKQTIVKFMTVSIVFIVVMLVLVSGMHILYPLVYIVFPLSVVLFCITLFGKINIMHLFAMIILIAIGIDYGVYMHRTTTQRETRTAIKYALLSTLAGFGVLIFSHTVALHSIGLVITVGIGAIFILLWGTSDR